ncbi:hypothetical protein H8D30_02330 [bacterium]|nr:hypothetical protein [bacterium]
MPTRLSLRAFTLAGALLWGAAVALTTLFFASSSYGGLWFDLLQDIYPGYELGAGSTTKAAFIGALYGGADGALASLGFAALYNALLKLFFPLTKN